MQIKEYLEKYQPVIYKTFKNSLLGNSLSHAYLLIGENGTNLLEIAKYLAKSIVCDDGDPFACNSCITCLRIEIDNYPDFIIYDGKKETIKRAAVNNIETKFEKTAFETKGIKIYILNLIENMTIEAINSILKFLEEPENNIYAFLTTNNENLILPTIISRCQVFHLRPVPRKEVIKESIENGISQDDAELLSYFYNDATLIEEELKNKDSLKDYNSAKLAFNSFLNALCRNKKEAIFIEQKEILPLTKSKESTRFFLDMLINIIEQCILKKTNKEILLKSYDTIIDGLINKYKNLDNFLIELLKGRNLINLNINTSLLLDHLTFTIIGKEEK